MKINNLNKSFGKRNIFTNTNIALPNKGIVYLTGRNGSGKSTLLNIIACIDNNYTGDVIIDSKNLKDLTKDELYYYKNFYISYINQKTKLVNELTVFDNIKLSLLLKYDDDNFIENKIKEVLTIVNMLEYKDRRINTLSGGEQQRIMIARSLASNPKILLADEITSNLDDDNIKIIMDIITKVSKETLVIFITHFSEVIDNYPGEVFKIENNTIDKNTDHIKVSDYKISSEYGKPKQSKPFNLLLNGLIKDKFKINLLIILLLIPVYILISFNIITKQDTGNKKVIADLYKNQLIALEVEYEESLEKDLLYNKSLQDQYINEIKVENIVLYDIKNIKFKVFGESPKTKFDILITDYHASLLNMEFNDLVGYKIPSFYEGKNIDLNVSGILITKFDEFRNNTNDKYLGDIYDMNKKLFYNSFYVSKEYFDTYNNYDPRAYVSLYNSESDIKTNNRIISFNDKDLIIGSKPNGINEIVLDLPTIHELFNINSNNIETIFNMIKDNSITMTDVNNKNTIMKIVGITSSNSSISNEILYNLNNYEIEPTYTYSFNKSLTKTTKDLANQNTSFMTNTKITKDSQKINMIENLVIYIPSILIIFIILLLAVIIYQSLIYINNQKNNIILLRNLGMDSKTINLVYLTYTLIFNVLALLVAMILTIMLVSLLNAFLTNRQIPLYYTMFFNNTKQVLIPLLITIVISILPLINLNKLLFKKDKKK